MRAGCGLWQCAVGCVHGPGTEVRTRCCGAVVLYSPRHPCSTPACSTPAPRQFRTVASDGDHGQVLLLLLLLLLLLVLLVLLVLLDYY